MPMFCSKMEETTMRKFLIIKYIVLDQVHIMA